MRAWIQRQYGGPEMLTLREVPEPRLGPNDVLVRVRASSVNSGDVRVMRGDPLLVRLVFGVRRPREATRGMDVAGIVIARGAAVSDVEIGDRVGAEVRAAFAEVVMVAASQVVRLPDAVSDAAAAVLPVAGGTALLALERTGVTAGERVLVLGATGGVGSLAVALSAARGAHVTACVRVGGEVAVPTADAIHHRGATVEELCAAGRFDVVIDVSGDRPLRELQRMLAPGGRAALVAGYGGRVLGPLPRILRAGVLSRSRARLLPITAVADARRLESLVSAVDAGALRPHVGATFAFDQIPAAVTAVDAGTAVGKVLIRYAT